jgi:hypothetical protein
MGSDRVRKATRASVTDTNVWIDPSFEMARASSAMTDWNCHEFFALLSPAPSNALIELVF